MKKTLFLLAITLVVIASCKKSDSINQSPQSLNGKWRMVMVRENASLITITKPVTEQGNVDITFTFVDATKGIFTGITPSNDILQNDYLTGTNQSITIPSLSMTKVGEPSWGLEFVNNICKSQQYSFDANGKLSIKTIDKTLVFQKF